MIAQLRSGRAIELSKTKNICGTNDFKGSLAGLYRRGLVNTKMVMRDGKEIVSVFTTQAGISFLYRYEEDAKRLGCSEEALPD